MFGIGQVTSKSTGQRRGIFDRNQAGNECDGMSEQTSVSQVAGKSNFWESADIEPVRNVKIRKGRSNQSRSDRSSCVVQFKGRQSQRQRQPSLTTKSWMELENRAPVIALSANRDPAGILLSHPILSYPIPPTLPLIPRYLSLCATTTTKLKSKSKPNTGLSHLKAASRSKERSERKRENEKIRNSSAAEHT